MLICFAFDFRKNLLIGASIGVIWRKRRKKRKKKKNSWRKRKWKQAFNPWTACQGAYLSTTQFGCYLYIITLTSNSLFFSLSTPTGVETPDVIDLRKQQRKEPEKPLYQVSALFVILQKGCLHFLFVYLISLRGTKFLLMHTCLFPPQIRRSWKRKKKRLPQAPCLELHTRMYWIDFNFIHIDS